MAGKTSIECPACLTRLNLSDDKLGKKIRCPKCAEVFLAEAPEDDFEDEPKQSSGKQRPKAGGRDSGKGPKKGSKKGNSTEGGSSLPLIIGGSIALLVLAGAGLFFSGVLNPKPLAAPPNANNAPLAAMPMAAMPMPPAQGPPAPPASQPAQSTPISPAEQTLALRWMPTETDLFVHAKLAEIWQAPLLKGPLSNPSVTTGLQEFEKQFGVAVTDIESISIGFVDLMQTFIKTKENTMMNSGVGMPGPPMAMMPLKDAHCIVVIKSKKPIDLKATSQAIPNTTLQEKNGKTYFEVPANLPVHDAYGGWSPSSNTLILASSKELFATMERGETVIPRKEFTGIDHLPQLVIASLMSGASSPATPSPGNPMELPGVVSQAMQLNQQFGITSGRLGLSVKGGFDLQVSTVSDTAEGARKVKTELEALIGEFRPVYDGYKSTAPPLIAELGDLLLTNLKIEEQNSTVKVSTNIPDSAQQKLEQLPAIVMMMAMTGGLGGPAGRPGGGPGFGIGMQSFDSPMPMGIENSFALPGETEAVEATFVEGLPGGLTISAKSAWSNIASTPSPDGKVTDVIEILIDVKGDGLEAICAATGATSKTLTAEGGGTLKRSKRVPLSGIDVQKTFLPFDVDNSLSSEHPPMTLRVRMAVDAPAKMPSKISVLEGSFKYLTAESSKEFTIENVPQRAKTPLNEPEFKAAGLKLIRGPKDVVPQTLKLQSSKDFFLGRVEGTPGDVMSVTEVEKGGTIQRLYSNHADGKFPDEFEIGFKIYSNVKEQTVTFRLENVPLPSEQTKPVVSQQQATQPATLPPQQ